MLVEAYTANRLESFGIRSLKQVVYFSRSVNLFKDFCQMHDSARALSPAATHSCGMAACGEPAELSASKHNTRPELHSRILQEQCVASAFHRISVFSCEMFFICQ